MNLTDLAHIVREYLSQIDPWAEWIVGTIIFIGISQTLISLLYLIVAGRVMHRPSAVDTSEERWKQRAPTAPPLSLIAAAYNEAATITTSVKSLLDLHYPHYEIIVVNDGSKDDTLKILIEAFDLKPSQRAHQTVLKHQRIRQIYHSKTHNNLVVVDKENGGKADALNAGIDVSRSPLFCAVDADSMLETEALLYAVYPFLQAPDTVVAVGGTIRVANGCRVRGGQVVDVGIPDQLLPLLQNVEYIRAFLIARIAMSKLGILTLISGAFGVFSRSAAIMVGGYATDTVGEDYELILRLHRHHLANDLPYEIRSVAEPVCWTEVPDNLTNLSNQRRRWQRGGLDAFFRHRNMLLNPRYGRLGMIGMVIALIVDVLGPIAELCGYLLVPLFYFGGILNFDYVLAFIGLTFVFGIFVSTGSLVLEEHALHRHPKAKDLLKLMTAIVIENFGYRQLNTFWRIQGWVEFLRKKQGWGTMTRTGFKQS